jgi:subfamily B ATP-binding cassette protein MsbA
VVTALELAAPWPLKFAVDQAIGHQPLPPALSGLQGWTPSALAALAAAFGVILVVAGGALGYLRTHLLTAASERMGDDLRIEVFAHLQRLSLRWHDRNRTGDLVNRLTADVGRVQDTLVSLFDTLVPDSLALIGMFIVMVLVDARLAVAAVAVVPFLILYLLLSRARLTRTQRAARDRSSVLATTATEILRNVRAVQVFAREQHAVAEFRSHSRAVAHSSIAATDAASLLSPVADLILAVGSGLVLWTGVMGVISHRITVGLLLVALTYLGSVYGPIRSLSRWSSTMARGAASRERLAEILDVNVSLVAPPAAPPAPDERLAGVGPAAIEFRSVSFAYAPDAPVLAGVSFRVEPGQSVAIVGPTGAGKSTILALLLRLYETDRGTIALGGGDIRRLTLASLRAHVTLVPQDPWILDGTIADNIAFGLPGATPEQVRAAGHAALVDEFADRLPAGYGTVVGEGGALLSGGQRRRIALARALLRDAPVLLLDEPTTGLDAASEREVLAAIAHARAGKTIITVTHQLRLAEAADRVLVVQGGRIIEQGHPDRLVLAGGPFAELWRLQNGAPAVPPAGVGAVPPAVPPAARPSLLSQGRWVTDVLARLQGRGKGLVATSGGRSQRP